MDVDPLVRFPVSPPLHGSLLHPHRLQTGAQQFIYSTRIRAETDNTKRKRELVTSRLEVNDARKLVIKEMKRKKSISAALILMDMDFSHI